MFLVNSRLRILRCVLHIAMEEMHIPRVRILVCLVPSRTFTRSPWRFRANPPVSVYGTIPILISLKDGFLGSLLV